MSGITPHDVLHREGTAQLTRFRRPAGSAGLGGSPLLLVPSLINRWYVLDLREGASLAAALTRAGIDTWCLDWGIPEDEDRYLAWDQVLDRLARAMRLVRRHTGAERIGLLGYCMGGTLAGIATALWPEHVATLINLAGPFDFSQSGLLGTMVDPRWFDVEAVAAAGNVKPMQMQSGFVALRPTLQMGKWVNYLDRAHDPRARAAFDALEEWSSDNIPFPAAAYETYIRELYQENRLIAGTHHVRGRRVDLSTIRCPVMTIAAEQDTICPLASARGLNDRVGSTEKELLVVPGGHVGAVVGSRAEAVLYPAIASWVKRHVPSPMPAPQPAAAV